MALGARASSQVPQLKQEGGETVHTSLCCSLQHPFLLKIVHGGIFLIFTPLENRMCPLNLLLLLLSNQTLVKLRQQAQQDGNQHNYQHKTARLKPCGRVPIHAPRRTCCCQIRRWSSSDKIGKIVGLSHFYSFYNFLIPCCQLPLGTS